MAVKIRLARGGRKGIPYYTIVVARDKAPRDGDYLEEVGTYDPLLPKDHKDRVKINNERYNYWFQTGAKPTETVARLYRNFNNIPHPVKTYPPKKESKKASS